tara:strand:+ start:11601 stop:12446 length:846 start_codon:yes stop_codon:yes gene_type:complete
MANHLSTKESGTRREARDSADGSESYRTFTITFDSQANEMEALLAPGVPRYGEVHPQQGFIRALDIRVRSSGEADTLWTAEVHYRSPEFVDVRSLNPLTDPPIIRWTTVNIQEEIDLDVEGSPITNTVGEPIDPPPQRDFADLQVTIIRNESNWTADVAINFVNKLNQDEIFGFAPGIGRMVGISADRVYFDSLAYWEVTYQIVFRRGGWNKRFLNAGYREVKKPGSNETKEILDANGDKYQTPTPLSIDGVALGPNDAGQVYFVQYQVYEAVPFFTLQLE